MESGFHLADPAAFTFILEGVTHGFSVFASDSDLVSNKRNLPTTRSDKIKITKWLMKAVETGWLLGPFTDAQLSAIPSLRDLHISPMGCVLQPKEGDPHNRRIITHMSAPRSGGSINASISDEHKYVEYIQLREICKMFHEAGDSAFLWVADVADAYLYVKLRLQDRKFMGVRWMDRTLVYSCLCFGTASAPNIYTRFADAIEFIIAKKCGLPTMYDRPAERKIRHYLDDFFGVATCRAEAQRQLDTLIETWNTLGVKWKEHKIQQPATQQRLLGFQFDIRKQILRLPYDKVSRYTRDIDEALGARAILLKKAESLIGKLRWCATACFGAQAFIKDLENEMINARQRGKAWLNISSRTRTALELARTVINELCYGVPLDYYVRKPDSGDIHVYSDASSTRGAGGYTSYCRAYSLRWDTIWANCESVEINIAELIALWIVVKSEAAAWANKSITFYVDNASVASWLAKKSSRLTTAQYFLKDICELAFQYRFYYWVEWIPREQNEWADFLSKQEQHEHVKMRDYAETDLTEALQFLRRGRTISLLNTVLTFVDSEKASGECDSTSDEETIPASVSQVSEDTENESATLRVYNEKTVGELLRTAKNERRSVRDNHRRTERNSIRGEREQYRGSGAFIPHATSVKRLEARRY